MRNNNIYGGTGYITINKLIENLDNGNLKLSNVQRQKKDRKSDCLGFLKNCWNTVLANVDNHNISLDFINTKKVLGLTNFKNDIPIAGNQIYIDNKGHIWDAQHRIDWIVKFLENNISLGEIGDERLDNKTYSDIKKHPECKKLIKAFKDLKFIVTMVDDSRREVIGSLFNDVNKSKPLSPLDKAKALCSSPEVISIFEDFINNNENEYILKTFYPQSPSKTFLKTLPFLSDGGNSNYSILFNSLQKNVEQNNREYIDNVFDIFNRLNKLEENSKIKTINGLMVSGVKCINAFIRLCIIQCDGLSVSNKNKQLKFLYKMATDCLLDFVKNKTNINYNGYNIEISGHSTNYIETGNLVIVFKNKINEFMEE